MIPALLLRLVTRPTLAEELEVAEVDLRAEVVVAATIEAEAVELVGLRLRIPMAPAKRTAKSLFLQPNRTLGKLPNLKKPKKRLTGKRQNLMKLKTAPTLLLQM
jgi:hypothetical protein